MTLPALRKKLKMSRSDFARALNVHERTVERWETGSAPTGLAAEVIKGLGHALATCDNHGRISRRLSLGVGALLCYGLTGKLD